MASRVHNDRVADHPGIARARALLEPEFETARADPQTGVLDLLGDDAEVSETTFSQRLMHSTVLPQVYERWWRPGLGKVLMGFTGPGISEEQRISRLMLGLSTGDGVLDVCCGTGAFTRSFAHAVGETGLTVGVDASATMLEQASAESPDGEIAYVRADAERLPFVDDAFDGVCCFAALYLMDDPMACLDEMARVLTPGGRIAIMTSIRRQPALRVAKPVLELLSGVRLFEREEIVDALASRNFDEVHLRVSGLAQFVGARLTG